MLLTTRMTATPTHSLRRKAVQLGIAIAERIAALSIFQPALKSMNRIAIAKMGLNNIRHETAANVTHKTVDTFCLIIRGPPLMTNVPLILESLSVGPRCDRPANLQVNIRMVNNYVKHSVSNERASSLIKTECTSGMVSYF
jgi:hypothetical protein